MNKLQFHDAFVAAVDTLGRCEVAVLHALMYRWGKAEDPVVYPSRADIAHFARLSEGQVSRALTTLQRLDWVTPIRSNGKRSSYLLHHPDEAEPVRRAHGTSALSAPTGAQGAHDQCAERTNQCAERTCSNKEEHTNRTHQLNTPNEHRGWSLDEAVTEVESLYPPEKQSAPAMHRQAMYRAMSREIDRHTTDPLGYIVGQVRKLAGDPSARDNPYLRDLHNFLDADQHRAEATWARKSGSGSTETAAERAKRIMAGGQA